MRLGFRSLWPAIACAAALLAQGCSSVPVTSSGRHGLFDDLAQGGRHRRPGRAIAVAPTGNPVLDKPRDKRVREEKARAIVAASRQQLKAAGLNWPLKRVQITSPFGRRGRDFHEGIDLRCKVGTPVYAAQSGTVLYSGSKIRGYGKMIVIKHKGGLATVYAHASRLLVRKGQKVKIGQKIAISGQTGRATGPHLHFEVRSGVVAINPFQFLPQAHVAVVDTSARAPEPNRHELKGTRRLHPARTKGRSTVIASVHGSSDE